MRKVHEATTPSLNLLQRAPGRLSTEEVEKALGLPSGAWRRRRLYALKARSSAFKDIGILQGDSMIVEPGARVRPTNLLVVRDGDDVTVRRYDSAFSLATPHQPRVARQPSLFPMATVRSGVVGTVVGILRRDAAGRLRTVPLPAGTTDNRPVRGTLRSKRAQAELDRIDRVESLEKQLGNWGGWVQRNDRTLGRMSDAMPEFCKGLGERMATLLECMRQTSGERLFRALLNEVQSVQSEMERVRRGVTRTITGTPAAATTRRWRPPVQAACAQNV